MMRQGVTKRLVEPGSCAVSGRGARAPSRQELFIEDALFEVGVAVEEQGHHDVEVLADLDGDDIAGLGEIGDGADRALFDLEALDPYPGAVRQEGAAPAAGAGGADRGQRESGGARRAEAVVRREALCGAACL